MWSLEIPLAGTDCISYRENECGPLLNDWDGSVLPLGEQSEFNKASPLQYVEGWGVVDLISN